MKNNLILTINPGSGTTKIAIFENNDLLFLKSISHSDAELAKYPHIIDQYQMRKDHIIQEIKAAQIDLNQIDIIMARGGLIKPIKSGVYQVNQQMINDLTIGYLGEHASNLGGLIANDIVKELPNAKAYIADPVVIDELDAIARYSGHPEFKRISIFHALNHKAIARTYACSVGRKYEDLNLVVVHLGGGISVGAHRNGRVIDVNQALDGEGPFSPERSGTLPVGDLVTLCFSGKYTEEEVHKMIKGRGGMFAYLGTSNAYEVGLRVRAGDENAKLIQDAMAYQVAKEIGAMSTVLNGKVDAILLTGGVAYNNEFVNAVRARVEFIAPVGVFPGEDEMKALAMNGLMVLTGEIEPIEYK